MYIERIPQASSGSKEPAAETTSKFIKSEIISDTEQVKDLEKVLNELNHQTEIQPVNWIKVSTLTEQAQAICQQKHAESKSGNSIE